MQEIWNPDSPSLLPAIVCHADILGFSAMIEQEFEAGRANEFLQAIKVSIDKAYNGTHKLWTHDGESLFEMKLFTDNVAVAYPRRDPDEDFESELGAMLLIFADIQASLAADGFFLRGAIAAGDHYQDKDIVYGRAFLEAAKLDKSKTSPRLVIGPSLEPLVLKHLSYYHPNYLSPHHHYLLEDPKDKRLFVNYLSVAFEDFPDISPINYKLLEEHSKAVLDGLQMHKSNDSVFEKYAWLAAYHNYVCTTFANQYSARGHQGDSLLEMEYREEAREVLKYLVDFKGGPQPRPPRPLDSQRLQRRLIKRSGQ